MRLLLFLFALCPWLAASAKPNLLIITTDDMSCDSVGAFGCKLKDTTPHMDRLAARSLRFNHAHVVVGNCMPSRKVMWSGKYPHNNGNEGFKAISKASKTGPLFLWVAFFSIRAKAACGVTWPNRSRKARERMK